MHDYSTIFFAVCQDRNGFLFRFVNFAQTQVIFYSKLTSKNIPFFALYVQLFSIEIIAEKAVLHLVTHHLYKRRSRIAALYTKKPPRIPPHERVRILGGIRLSGMLQSENVLLYSFLSASTIFSEGRYKNIQIDRLFDKGMLFCNSPKISFFLITAGP